MVSFLALYRGDTVASAELLALSADPELVGWVTEMMLQSYSQSSGDPVRDSLLDGKRSALERLRQEVLEAKKGLPLRVVKGNLRDD